MKRGLFALHRWLGLVSGIFLLLIGLSGAILVFKHPIERGLNPALFDIGPQGDRLSLDSAYSIVYRNYGSGFVSCSLDLPAGPGDVYEFTLTTAQESYTRRDLYVVTIHPYSGKILREGYCNAISTSPVRWLMVFHDSFHLGKTGMFIAALVAVMIFLSMITGLLYYGKNVFRVLMFRLPLKRRSRIQLYRTIHVYIGVWALLFNIVVSFTGFWMLRSMLSPGGWNLAEQQGTSKISASLEACIAKSREVLPGFKPDYVFIPFTENDPIEIDGNNERSSRIMYGDASYVMFDSQTGDVTEMLDATQQSFPKNLTAAFWQLHIGNYGGLTVKMLYAIGGLMPGILSLSGYVVWWKRKKLYASVRT